MTSLECAAKRLRPLRRPDGARNQRTRGYLVLPGPDLSVVPDLGYQHSCRLPWFVVCQDLAFDLTGQERHHHRALLIVPLSMVKLSIPAALTLFGGDASDSFPRKIFLAGFAGVQIRHFHWPFRSDPRKHQTNAPPPRPQPARLSRRRIEG
jgi:hypothetical protein